MAVSIVLARHAVNPGIPAVPRMRCFGAATRACIRSACRSSVWVSADAAPVRQGYVVSSQQPRRRQKRVLRLEAKRAAATIGYAILTLIAAAVSASAAWFRAHGGQVPGQVPASVPTIVTVAAAVLALILLIEA